MEIQNKTPTPLHPELAKMLKHLDEVRAFDPRQFVDRRCDELVQYLKKHDLKATVVSVSGGVDSAVVLSLLAETKRRYADYHDFRIIALAQPICSTPEIQNRAYEVAKVQGIEVITVDQTAEHCSLIDKIERQTGALTQYSKSMFKSYQRTPTAYLLAANYGGIVVGTGNLDEDGHLYYYCKFGDGAVDVGIIWDLHKCDVFRVAEYLNVPRSILDAPPSADLAPGQTDEGEIGVTYDMVRLVYTLNHSSIKMTDEQMGEWIYRLTHLSPAASMQYMTEKNIIDAIHMKGHHKADLNPFLIGKGTYGFSPDGRSHEWAYAPMTPPFVDKSEG